MSDLTIIDEIIKDIDIKNYSQDELRKHFENEGRKKKLSENVMNYLLAESDLKRFVTEFQRARNVQICFMIDVTGSMSSHENFKNNIIAQIIDVVMENVSDSKKHYGYIGYRERNEDNAFVQMTNDLDEVRNAIKNEKLSGGDDAAEDVEHAFELFSRNIRFLPGGTRILIHIADCPAHGTRYHEENISDNHPEWSDKLDDYLVNITSNFTCFYWFVKIAKWTDKMIDEFNEILQKHCSDIEGLDKVKVLDLRDMKQDIRSIILQRLNETVLQSTKLR